MAKKAVNQFSYQGWAGPADVSSIIATLDDLKNSGKRASPALEQLITSLLTATPSERYAYNIGTISQILSKREVINFSRDGVTELEHGLLTWVSQQQVPTLHDAFEQMLSLYDRRIFVLQFGHLFEDLREVSSSV
jgi:hypothetical protein